MKPHSKNQVGISQEKKNKEKQQDKYLEKKSQKDVQESGISRYFDTGSSRKKQQ